MEHVGRRVSLHWICFACRKQFRQALRVSRNPPEGDPSPERIHRCPECKQAMIEMGRYFCPPARRKLREWEELRRLAEHGYRFRREGHVSWVRFVTRATTGHLEAEALIYYCSCQLRTEGQRLLRRIRQRYGATCR